MTSAVFNPHPHPEIPIFNKYNLTLILWEVVTYLFLIEHQEFCDQSSEASGVE